MSRYVEAETRRLVVERASGICEYCLIAEEDSYYRHEIDHIISIKHGGLTVADNLALACVFCNRSKGSDVASIGAGREDRIRFFNPRTDVWSDHFRLNGMVVSAVTEIGHATIRILQINDDDRVLERQVLHRVGRYPSEAARSLIQIH